MIFLFFFWELVCFFGLREDLKFLNPLPSGKGGNSQPIGSDEICQEQCCKVLKWNGIQ